MHIYSLHSYVHSSLVCFRIKPTLSPSILRLQLLPSSFHWCTFLFCDLDSFLDGWPGLHVWSLMYCINIWLWLLRLCHLCLADWRVWDIPEQPAKKTLKSTKRRNETTSKDFSDQNSSIKTLFSRSALQLSDRLLAVLSLVADFTGRYPMHLLFLCLVHCQSFWLPNVGSLDRRNISFLFDTVDFRLGLAVESEQWLIFHSFCFVPSCRFSWLSRIRIPAATQWKLAARSQFSVNTGHQALI